MTEYTVDAAFQRRCADFVHNNVHLCVSGTVQLFLDMSDQYPYWDDLQSAISETSACGECEGSGELECETCDGNGEVDCATCEGSGLQALEEDCETCDSTGEVTCKECDGETICKECGGDAHPHEVFEYWAIDRYFAARLREQGETCFDGDIIGIDSPIWCRTTTGQSISVDGVVERIVRALEADTEALLSPK